ncbi:hypothetical protein [Rugamonas apoptosis]|uniref:Uncharacterized protein n=1 Tax=Rugamonas apoptosis TaxID=2758570 RepID=A0A7W2ILY5_9BURK|nr:hypothetical protein [Rugamonas apoptosis]MBA5688936.1 hypothetical protein [Rugamonas apoptosis]
MARNKIIQNSHVTAIVDMVRSWPHETIAWDAICVASGSILGYVPTRQGLNGHQRIKDAVHAKKKLVQAHPVQRQPMPSSLAVASDSISRLNLIIKALEQENARLLTYVTIMQYNAYANGLTKEQIENPLPKIDRGRAT